MVCSVSQLDRCNGMNRFTDDYGMNQPLRAITKRPTYTYASPTTTIGATAGYQSASASTADWGKIDVYRQLSAPPGLTGLNGQTHFSFYPPPPAQPQVSRGGVIQAPYSPNTGYSMSRHSWGSAPKSNLNADSHTFIPKQTELNRNAATADNAVGSYSNFPSSSTQFLPSDLISELQSHSSDSTTSSEASTKMILPQMAVEVPDVSTGMSALQISPPISSPWSNGTCGSPPPSADYESDSDDEAPLSHPNKFPVEIEDHFHKSCCYRRQPTRSGEVVKQRVVNSLNPQTLLPETDLQKTRTYQKHLVRICRCGRYNQMDGALQHGRNNDCNGYEIHYSQKCRWKGYTDFKTGRKVLIRLCKCYKPQI